MHDLSAKLKTFVAIAEQGNFASGARQLGIANSSASRQIALLESYFGTSLIIRNTRQFRLSPAGERLYQQSKPLLEGLDNLVDAVNVGHQQVSGVLRVSVPWRYARMHLAPLVAKFIHAYPDMRVELVSCDDWVDLVKEGFDVAVRLGRLRDSNLIARKLGQQAFAVVASPDYLAKHSPVEDYADLNNHKILTYAYSSASYTWKFRAGDTQHQLSIRRPTLSSNNADVIAQATIEGAGISLQPLWAVDDDLASGRLTSLLTQYQVTPSLFDSGIYAVYHQEGKHNPRIRAWVDFLLAHLVEQ